MADVKVYRFKKYDIATGNMKISHRFATIEAIDKIHATILKETEIIIDSSALGIEIEGMTNIDFTP